MGTLFSGSQDDISKDYTPYLFPGRVLQETNTPCLWTGISTALESSGGVQKGDEFTQHHIPPQLYSMCFTQLLVAQLLGHSVH